MKKMKMVLLIIAVVLIPAAITYFTAYFADRPPELHKPVQIGKVEMQIDQGVKTEIPRPKSGLISIVSGQKIEVETEVKKIPSTPVVSSGDSKMYTPETHQKATVTREVDAKGNTSITVLTPVTPVYKPKIDGNSNPIPSPPDPVTGTDDTVSPTQPQIDQEWMVVETQIDISRYHSRVKDIFLLSSDGDKEWGKALEMLRLESKPGWMPEWLYNPLEWSSVDLIVTPNLKDLGIERVGVGVSKEVYSSEVMILDIGIAGTYQLPTKERELAGYLSVDF